MSLVVEVTWGEIKRIAGTKSKSVQWTDSVDRYNVAVVDGPFTVWTVLDKASADAAEFVASYKTSGNTVLDVKDSDGSSINRTKTTRTGWHYEPRSLDFTTSKKGSLYNRKHNGAGIYDGTDYGDAFERFFDAAGAQLVQAGGENLADYQIRLDANCVKTHIDWQSTAEIDIIGATVSVLNPPTGNDHGWAWVIVAPDIPEAYGGSVPFMAGGWNLRFLSQTTFLDGRGVKAFIPDFVYNSNKMRVVIKHETGAKIECQFVVEKFNA